MKELKTISLDVDIANNKLGLGIELFSLGTPPNYSIDDHPMTIVRFTGLRVTLKNHYPHELDIITVYLAIVLDGKIISLLKSANSVKQKVASNKEWQICFQGKALINILDNTKEEKGKFLIDTSKGLFLTSFILGEEVEKQLTRLNNNTDDAYQNWGTDIFSELLPIDNIDQIISKLEYNF